MKKRIKGRSLGRVKGQKKALMKTLLVSLIENKKIITTLAKARELKPYAERQLTLAKRGLTEESRSAKIRLLKKELPRKAVNNLFVLAELSKRNGGYTRIVKLMSRKSDVAPMAMVEWVDQPPKPTKKKPIKKVEKESSKKADTKKSTDKISKSKKDEK